MERITMPETGVEYFLEDGTYTPVKKTCIFEELGGTYRMEGRFLMPNVKYPDPEPVNYGTYGRMRLEFLEENEIDELSQMMYAGTLGQHLKMIDDQANERWDRMEEKLEEIKKTHGDASDVGGGLAGLRGTADKHSRNRTSEDPTRARVQLNLFSEEEPEPKAEISTVSAFFLPQSDIDYVVRMGPGVMDGKYRVYFFYQDLPNRKDAVSFLKAEYGIGGSSITLPSGQRGFSDHDAKGIRMGLRSV
jgi:hypothetical protein